MFAECDMKVVFKNLSQKKEAMKRVTLALCSLIYY